MEQKLYLVSEWDRYEGGNPIALFSNLKEAKRTVEHTVLTQGCLEYADGYVIYEFYSNLYNGVSHYYYQENPSHSTDKEWKWSKEEDKIDELCPFPLYSHNF